MTSLPPLLITSAVIIASDHLVKLRSVSERIRYTLEAIDEWLKMVPEIKIVLCDGSGFDLGGLVKKRWPQSEIEVLFFQNDSTNVSLLGKGYGEGEIILHALENSRTLRDHDMFMKCTSKLWISNFDAVVESCGSTRFTVRKKFLEDGSAPSLIDSVGL